MANVFLHIHEKLLSIYIKHSHNLIRKGRQFHFLKNYTKDLNKFTMKESSKAINMNKMLNCISYHGNQIKVKME